MESVIETFKPCIEKGYDIVAFAISEDMSTSANVMRLAAQERNVEDIRKGFDAAYLSSGI